MTIKTKSQPKKGTGKIPSRRGPGPRAGEWLPWVGGALVVVALALLVWWGIKKQYPDDHTVYDPVTATVGRPDAPLTLDVYEDFLCPACAGFEAHYGEQIVRALGDGKLRVHYHILNFLDKSSASGSYSTRAAAAARAVFEKAPDKFLDFHKKLFEPGTQPQEGTASDLTNDQLAQIAEQVGAAAAAPDIRSGTDLKSAVGSGRVSVEQLSKLTGGNVSTPSIVKDGKLLNLANGGQDPNDKHVDPSWLQKLVDATPPAQAPVPAAPASR